MTGSRSANRRDPVAVVVPCHLLARNDGNLRGYAGGLERKTALLALEDGGAPADDTPPRRTAATA